MKTDIQRTATDYFINLKQARGKIIKKLKARERKEISNKRTELYNFAEKVNSSSPVVKQLAKANLSQDDFPTHISLIPDGNRRWANDRQLTVGQGYAAGAEVIKDFRKWSMVDNSTDVVSAFLMSTENIKRRPEGELSQLFSVFIDFFNGVAENDFVHENKIRHEVRGNDHAMDLLPDEVTDSINTMEKATSQYEDKKMVFLLGYGSRDDIARAARKTDSMPVNGQITVTEEGEDDNEFRQNLMLGDLPDADLMIRTSESRLSNYMLYSNAYSEFIFKDMMWPAYTETEYWQDMYNYANRDRRFGV